MWGKEGKLSFRKAIMRNLKILTNDLVYIQFYVCMHKKRKLGFFCFVLSTVLTCRDVHHDTASVK